MDFGTLERYRPLVDDPAAFCQALAQPLPVCVWTNTTRATPKQLEAWLQDSGSLSHELPWYPGAFRLTAEAGPGNRFEYLAGLSYVQEEVSLLPVVLLDPQPGERILDLCAAPGNKTAQIALKVGPRGTVIANDRSLERISILRRNVSRLGIAHCATTVYDATGFPAQSGAFDRVLADVPCSCEGTTRKFPGLFERPRPMEPGKLAGLQAGILRKAVQLCKVGGRIVYSTCTYAPEENEAVVQKILDSFEPGALKLLPARIPHFHSAPGLEAWQGQTFSPDMGLAMRVYPHLNDTGGFFVAVLEKCQPVGRDAEGGGRPPEGEDPTPWFSFLEERFGLPPEAFEGLVVLRPNRRCLALATESLSLPHRPREHTAGLPFLYWNMKQPKLTSSAAMHFAAAARRNIVDLTREQTTEFLHRHDFPLPADQASQCESNGYVLTRHQGYGLGIGSYRRDDSRHHLESLYPKGWKLAPGRSPF